MKEQNYQVIISELVRRSNEDTRRLRVLEQRMEAIETRLAANEDSMLDKAKKTHTHFVELDERIRQLNEGMITIKNTLDKINRQINSFARKRDIRELERMMDLVKPETEDVIELKG